MFSIKPKLAALALVATSVAILASPPGAGAALLAPDLVERDLSHTATALSVNLV